MKIFSICTALAIFAGVSHAAPLDDPPISVLSATITFLGAPPNVANFTLIESLNGSTFFIKNPLSVSKISLLKGPAICTFFGIDGSVTVVRGGQTIDVGPPQRQLRGTCTA